jgi:hypothetical protein
MPYEKRIIKINDFVSSFHKEHQIYGVSSIINIPRIILRLSSFLEQKDKTNSDEFYLKERELYTPICDDLEALLPVPIIVDKESVLKELDNPKLETDISIRDLFEIDKKRKDNFKSYCFIEIKSVFFDERISKSDIFEDLEKLLDCEEKYSAKCFFTLVGTACELKHSPSALSLLRIDIPNVRKNSSFEITTKSGRKVWLMPSGSSLKGKFTVYIWTVSSKNKFPKGHTSRSYSIFQQN